uniref:CSON013479 protein n=1 Tax=Culicoides sonorensis TaxID=179676 RepID=A0A336K6J2_CULSO
MYEESAMTTTTDVSKLNNNALPSIASTSQLINISNATAANITVAIVSTQQQSSMQNQPQTIITEMHPSSSSSTTPTSIGNTILAPISSGFQSASHHVAILSHQGSQGHLGQIGTTKIIINNNSILTHEQVNEAVASASLSPTTTTLCVSSPPPSSNINFNNNNNNESSNLSNKSKAIIPNINNNNNSASNKRNVIVSTNQISGHELSYDQHTLQQQQQHQTSSTHLIITTVPTSIASHSQIVPVTSVSDQDNQHDEQVTTLQNLVTTTCEQLVSPSSGIIVQANSSKSNDEISHENRKDDNNDDGGASTSMSTDNNMVEFDMQDLDGCSTDETSGEGTVMVLFKGGIFAQYYAVGCANLITFIYGIAVGWPSASLPLLKSENTPLPCGPISLLEASWIGSILCIGGALGTIFFSFLADRYGRKPGIMFGFVPMVTSWLLIEFGHNFYSLFFARFFTGFAAGASFQIAPLIVSEVSDVNVRGSLGSLLILFHNGGALVGITLSSYFDYFLVPWVAIILSFIFLLGYSVVPETPKYLMLQGKKSEALKSLEFFKGDSERAQSEFKSYEMSPDQTEEFSQKISCLDICEPATRKALIIGTIIMNSVVFCGAFTLTNYYETIFKEAGSSLSPAMSSIIVAFIQFAGTYSATLTVERIGRKTLILTSAYIAAILLAIIGLYSYLKEIHFDVSMIMWLPLVCLSLLVFVAANGASSVPFVVIGEIFAQHVRGPLVSFCIIVNWLMSFVAVLVFPYMMEYLRMYGALWVFSAVGTILATIVAVMMPETKGLSIETIIRLVYPTSFLSLRWLLSDEIANVALQLRELVGSNHPLLKTAKNLIYNGKTNMQAWGLIVLLVSKAAGYSPTISVMEEDKSAGVLHSQRALAEVTEMIRTSHLVHQGLINLQPLANSGNDLSFESDMIRGNKIALLCGDYLLGSASVELAKLRNQDLNELISSAFRDLSESNFIGDRDDQNNPLPSDPRQKNSEALQNYGDNFDNSMDVDNLSPMEMKGVMGNPEIEWAVRHILSAGSLLGKSCQGALKLAGLDEDLQKQGYLFGKNLALAWQACIDLEPFKFSTIPTGAQFSLVSAPVLFHLEYDPSLYEEIKKGSKSVDNIDYQLIHSEILKGPGLEKTRNLARKHCEAAMKYIKKYTSIT